MGTDLKSVLITKEEIDAKLAELAEKIDEEYAGKDLLLVGVLKGAVMVMADLARAVSAPATMDWMAVSSYGAGTQSSGVVRILKDLDTDIKGKHVLIVEDIIDSGLTLSWLLSNLGSREPASLNVVTLLRKPDAAKVDIDVKWVGFDTASTTRRSTATCPSSGRSHRTCTAADADAGAVLFAVLTGSRWVRRCARELTAASRRWSMGADSG
jgi:hypoxanthine phosphoribosyltransferase